MLLSLFWTTNLNLIIAYQHTHTLPRTNCSSKKQAIMIDNVPVGWKLANSLLASQFSDIPTFLFFLREVLMPEVVTMKFRRLLQALLVQPTSKAQGEASVVATPFFTGGEVGVHRKVRVHSCNCDDILSSDCANLVSPLRAIPCWVLGITLWVLRC